MQAIILAGGKGKRLYPLTSDTPKPMIQVGDKPILEHIINFLKKNSIKKIIISVGYLKDQITSYFGNGRKFGISISYLYETLDYPLGTAGAIAKARKLINESFIVTYGDILRELEISKMFLFHKKKKALVTIAVYKNNGRNPKSIIEFDDNKKIIFFAERPIYIPNKNFHWSNASFYILEPKIFQYIPVSRYSDFGKDIFPKLINNNINVYAFVSRGKFIDIGSMNKLNTAKETFFS